MRRLILVLFLFAVMGIVFALRALVNTTPGAVSAQVAPNQSAISRSQHTGNPIQPSAAAQPEVWTPELFFVRAQGQLTAYDMSNGQQRFALPPGVLSADGKRYMTVEPERSVARKDTVLQNLDPRTGSELNRFSIQGEWSLSGVSHSGRWVALTRLAGESEKAAWTSTGKWNTDIEIVDANSGQVAHSIHLDGNFQVETIAPSGDALFLIEHLPAINPDRYLIRLYDLRQEKLQDGALRDKAARDEVMTGLAWDGVASPDGHWLLTLYLNIKRNVAFVHTLDLLNKFPVCIDLPSGNGNFDELKYYTLALSPDNHKLYAANAALGVVAVIDLDSRQVVRKVEFQATAAKYNSQSPTSRSVVSRDGKMVFFTSGWDVWALDTRAGKVQGPYQTGAKISDLGLSVDGKRLFAATESQGLLVFDAASGSPLSFPHASSLSQSSLYVE